MASLSTSAQCVMFGFFSASFTTNVTVNTDFLLLTRQKQNLQFHFRLLSMHCTRSIVCHSHRDEAVVLSDGTSQRPQCVCRVIEGFLLRLAPLTYVMTYAARSESGSRSSVVQNIKDSETRFPSYEPHSPPVLVLISTFCCHHHHF